MIKVIGCVTEILRETLDSLHSGNSAFQSAKSEAANDMLKYMRIVFPIATKTQMVVLANHGYTSQGEGRCAINTFTVGLFY